ncbi:MAG: response regulator [Candidatus Koribacter versatilis]|uniref:Response regulator n=1 Tax=Candidatus Korobacter versatilis TaxID=658062 RepID=A0A932A6Q4_9BACT|nr:response regulator [Candidatus Koribacter versatilis]
MKNNSKNAPKSRVLVVDDEPSVLLTYRMILEQQGYEVTASISSKDAIAALEAGPMDLLICDLSLEQKHTGFEVIDFGRRGDPQVPAILVTGYASKEVMDKAEQNMIAVLFKPIDIHEFLSAISEKVRSRHESHQTKAHD